MPRRSGSFNQQDALDMNELGGGGTEGGNGMGNLADELADAFSESGEEEDDDGADDETAERSSDNQKTDQDDRASSPDKMSRERDGSLPIPHLRRRGHHHNESIYDGSDYGSESDLDSSGMAPSFVAKVDAIESLARRGTGNYGGETDDVVRRVTEALRSLGSQSSVEGGASRCVFHLSHSMMPSIGSADMFRDFMQADNGALCPDDAPSPPNAATSRSHLSNFVTHGCGPRTRGHR